MNTAEVTVDIAHAPSTALPSPAYWAGKSLFEYLAKLENSGKSLPSPADPPPFLGHGRKKSRRRKPRAHLFRGKGEERDY